MQIGDTILILPSYALNELRLGKLAGTQAEIIQIVKRHGSLYGCWVRLPEPFQGEIEWFIPQSSII